MPSPPPHAVPADLPGNLWAQLAEACSPAVGNGQQSLLAQQSWNRSQILVSTNRAVSLVHKQEIMPSFPPEACPRAHPWSPRTHVRMGMPQPSVCPRLRVYTPNPLRSVPAQAGPVFCWHTHTCSRTVLHSRPRWCGYTPAHASVGSLSDCCHTVALLGIRQVPAADQGELGF